MADIVKSIYDGWDDLTQDKYDRIVTDFEKFCSDAVRIVDKSLDLVPFIHNSPQKKINDFIIPHLFSDNPKPVTLLIHKTRQVGASTDLFSLEDFACMNIPGFRVRHIMPTEDESTQVFNNKFIPQLEGIHPDVLPLVTRRGNSVDFKRIIVDGTEAKRGDNDINLDSSIKFSSALIKGAGHGSTLNMVVLDEYAHYERTDKIEKGILATLAKDVIDKGGKRVKKKKNRVLTIYMSTANGHNKFYELYKAAQRGDSDIKYLFIPWHMMEEYQMEPKGRLKELTYLTEYELLLCDIFEKEGYPIQTWAPKLQFYDWVLKNECQGDLSMMHANYPSYPEESFSASSQSVLPTESLVRLRDKADEHISERGYFTVDSEAGKFDPFFEPDNRGNCTLFKRPVNGHKYIIGIDPTGGGYDGDPSAAVVIDLTTLDNVCSFHDEVDTIDLAETMIMLGKFYNNAILIPENNTGQPLIMELRDRGYTNIYRDPNKILRDMNAGRQSEFSITDYGIRMTSRSKDEAIRKARKLLLNNIYTDYDKDFIKEALQFVWMTTAAGNKKATAPKGEHDDRVMARLVALYTINIRKFKLDGK